MLMASRGRFSQSDDRVAGLGSNTTHVVFVASQHEVSLVSPHSAPAEVKKKKDKKDSESQKQLAVCKVHMNCTLSSQVISAS